ncbi:MAG: hypothetical protein HYX40_07090 [Sphingobacteriales bacterium]|nr:hypothetical protein [Sphingobacteriales bacterium]
MKKVKLDNILVDLKNKLSIFNGVLQFSTIEKYSYIIEVGALTISTDKEGRIILKNTVHPMLFSLERANEISNMNFRTEDGKKVHGKIYFRNDWYRSRITDIEESIELFNKQANHLTSPNA